MDPGTRVRRVRKVRRRRRRWPWLAAAALVVVGLLLVGEAIHLRATLAELTRAQRVLMDSGAALGSDPAGWTDQRVVNAAALQEEGLRGMTRGSQSLQGDPLLSVLGVLPLAGDQVAATRDLARAGEAGGQAIGDEIAVARAYLGARSQEAPAGKKLLALVSATTAPLAHATSVLGGQVTRLEEDHRRALVAPLGARVTAALDVLRPRRDQAAAVAGVGRYLPVALGGAGPKSYLLLLPNPAELRPAGGFAGAVGSITFTEGTPGNPDIHDEDELDKQVTGSFPPPEDIAHYMKFPYGRLDLGDNLDPQFPRQAATSEALYRSATGLTADGTISIDPYAISAMLEITGPIDVAGYGRFDSTNFFPRLDEIVNAQHGPGSGKVALSPISRVILQRVLNLPLSAYPRLLSTLQQQARQRHIQFSLHDPAAAKAAAGNGYDGGLAPVKDDFLLISEANVGGTKGDYFLHRSMSLRAEVRPGGLSRHEVVMHYEMPAPANAVDRELNPLAGSYQDYLRAYIPQEATVRSLTYSQDGGKPASALDSLTTDLGRKVAAAFFVLPRGHRAELRLVYDAPLRGEHSAQLYIQKQPGQPGYPIDLQVSYPGQVLSRRLLSDRDRILDLSW